VPKVGAGGRKGLPRHLSPEQLEELLESLSECKPATIRSRAVVLCLSKLGLRAGEVARLRLDDIDWRAGTVRLQSSKCRRSRQLPLTVEVGRSLARYLREARPASAHREVFLSLLTHRPLSSQCISQLTAQALQQAGIDCVRPGAHLLRHTFATHLIQSGASLKALADLLGHRRLDTTMFYAKVNLTMLREVAQPWPEVGA
jgi:site-specific recombinase XerD